IPLDEAPETTESAEPCGTAGAITPGTGTLAGASIAFAGTFVPSGRAELPSLVSEAVALALTRLAVHTPDRSASGTKATALLRRDNGLLLIFGLSPLGHTVSSIPQPLDTSINDLARHRSRTNVSCDPHHTGRHSRSPRTHGCLSGYAVHRRSWTTLSTFQPPTPRAADRAFAQASGR